jgi:hypothetical protein
MDGQIFHLSGITVPSVKSPISTEVSMMKRMEKMAALASVLLAASLVGKAAAAETATGTISATPLGGGVNQFNISLTNTNATTSIGTFWFSWIPPTYDFMNVAPTNVTLPTGWIDQIVNDPGEGFSIEAYNIGGAGDQLAPGATGQFSFHSTETLAQLTAPGGGAGPLGAFYAQTTSFVYAGMPETDAGYQFTLTPVVPEPVSASILALGAGGLMLRRRRA